MGNLFRIVHLSDLHFSHGAFPNPALSHSLDHLLGIQAVVAGLDYDLLVVTGDLSNRGDIESLNQAKQWLLHKYATSDDRLTGLECPPEKLIPVPGNHDAYDCPGSGGKEVLARQKSLANWNSVFAQYSFRPPEDCHYYWRPKGGAALFVVAVDSSYLGDPEIEGQPDIARQAISAFSRIARGDISVHQTSRILRWFDLGMSGKLLTDFGSSTLISADEFARAFKILVMHHYYLEPPGVPDPSMDLRRRKTVLRNLAMADFDLVLCGHKHVPFFYPHAYGDFFPDRRSKGRYLWNLFRRLIHISTLPDTHHDHNGRAIKKALSACLSWLIRQSPRQPGETDEQYFDRLLDALRALLDDPRRWRVTLREYVATRQSSNAAHVSEAEAREIVEHIMATIPADERAVLSKEAGKIRTAVRNLGSRPVVQGMSGSSAKSFSLGAKDRAFAVLEIDADAATTVITHFEYRWPANGSKFGPPLRREQRFDAARRAPF